MIKFTITNDVAKHANKIDDIRKELNKREKLVKDLGMDVERTFAECNKFQNEHDWKVFRWKELEETRKDESCSIRRKQQEEEYFEIEDMKGEIEEEFNLDLLEAWCANAGVQCCEDCRKNEKAKRVREHAFK